MQCCFFEDDKSPCFKPLTLTRPVDDLRTGILTLGEKWRLSLEDATWSRCIREELRNIFYNDKIDTNVPCYWINSRSLPGEELINAIKELETGTFLSADETVVAAKVDGQNALEWQNDGKPEFGKLKSAGSVEARLVNYLWDLLRMNEDEIAADLQRLNYPASSNINISTHAILENEDNIFIGNGAKVEAGAIIMAQNGPVYIGVNAKISAGAIIEGPAAICEKSIIKSGAKIHANTTIGPVCKAAGDISNSIIHSYSNKAHDGYLGNSIIGQWCNLGADTNISNLKNNYGNIRIIDWNSQKIQETGQQFLGLFMADHSKTAIGTRINSGTVCGVSANIFFNDFPPKYIPSFSWLSLNEIKTYDFAKAIETMKNVMARRDVKLTDDYEKLMNLIFQQSARQK